jgi:hypothetical protein
MAIGGIFEAIFFFAAFGFVYSITPAKYKIGEKKESSRISQYLIGKIVFFISDLFLKFII